jgi:hypothetical protein
MRWLVKDVNSDLPGSYTVDLLEMREWRPRIAGSRPSVG